MLEYIEKVQQVKIVIGKMNGMIIMEQHMMEKMSIVK
ncbi:hypothetical protein IMSAGC022_00573 [Alistipes sp.]|nr:hypothetical protein IMSAGC022_00573 [Alistipes sp.]